MLGDEAVLQWDAAAVGSISMSDPAVRDPLRAEALSYSYRERAGAVWWNRISVTSLLFGCAMGASYLLGRPRR